ncbi:MAG: hypothetical protein LH649_10840 [Pseudanabaena sp. CAN_BIN31]|nr:hypothetical protein [Pseudanabaena sp. CAN_BIN31]
MGLGDILGNFEKNRSAKKLSFMNDDLSNKKVYSISQQATSGRMASPPLNLDNETVNLINWLAKEQGLIPEAALKKAIITAAYIYDVTSNQRGKLLVQHSDGSIREIFLK